MNCADIAVMNMTKCDSFLGRRKWRLWFQLLVNPHKPFNLLCSVILVKWALQIWQQFNEQASRVFSPTKSNPCLAICICSHYAMVFGVLPILLLHSSSWFIDQKPLLNSTMPEKEKNLQFIWPKDGPKGRGHRGFLGRLNNVVTNKGPDIFVGKQGSRISPDRWQNW